MYQHATEMRFVEFGFAFDCAERVVTKGPTCQWNPNASKDKATLAFIFWKVS